MAFVSGFTVLRIVFVRIVLLALGNVKFQLLTKQFQPIIIHIVNMLKSIWTSILNKQS